MTAAGWIIAVIWTVIILVLIAGAIYWLVSALSRGSGTAAASTTEPSGREILDQRLARGKLTIQQYNELRDAIERDQPPSRERPEPSPTAT